MFRAGATTVTHITSGDATILHSIKNPSYESYETIGPALPERPPIRLPPAPKTLDSIYEPEPDCISKGKFMPSVEFVVIKSILEMIENPPNLFRLVLKTKEVR